MCFIYFCLHLVALSAIIIFREKIREYFRGPVGMTGPYGMQGEMGVQGPRGEKGEPGICVCKEKEGSL